VLQVPHHGSATGLTAAALQAINPKMAAISVGKKNRYGHPKQSTLQLLKDDQTSIQRTDQRGDIEIVSDGKGWVVK
jgi:competence protein ComEC